MGSFLVLVLGFGGNVILFFFFFLFMLVVSFCWVSYLPASLSWIAWSMHEYKILYFCEKNFSK